jgi:hypothetical protein
VKSVLSIAISLLVLSSILGVVIQATARTAYGVEKVDTVKVTPRPIHVTLPSGTTVTVYHLFVVFTQKEDKSYVCQGFPLDPTTGQIPKDSDLPLNLPSPYLTQGRCIPFNSDNRDWDFRNGPSTTVVSGPDAKDAYKCFVKVTNAFNDAKNPYALLGPNSNTYARAILDGCHIPGDNSRLPPGVVPQLVPGWDTPYKI